MDQNQTDSSVPSQPVQPMSSSEMPTPISENQPKGKKSMFFAVLVLVVLILAGWGAYTVYASPSRLWQRFTAKAEMPKVVTEDYNFSYQDNGKLSGAAAESPFTAMFSDIKFSAKGTAYSNATDLSKPEATIDMDYSLGSGSTSIGSKAQFIFKDQSLYINMGSNPLVSSFLNQLDPGNPVSWIKLDNKEAMELNQQNASGTPMNLDYSQKAKAYQDIASKYLLKLVGQEKFIDKQIIHGIATYHYSNVINKDQVSAMAQELTQVMINQMSEQKSLKGDDLENFKNVVNKVVKNITDKIQVSDLETWVGADDSQLHKIKFVSNAPSFVSLVSAASDPAVADTANSQDLTDALLNKMTYDGQFTLEEELYDFGKIKPVNAPADSYDVFKKILEQQKMQNQMPPDLIEDKMPHAIK